MTSKKLNQLLQSGDIVQCSACGELSAYHWSNVDDQDPTDPEHVVRLGWSKGQVAHVGASSCYEFECGHCGANNVERNSPLTHPCYTHSED